MELKCPYSSWFKDPEEDAPGACHFENGSPSSTAKKKVVRPRHRRALSEMDPGGLSTKTQGIVAGTLSAAPEALRRGHRQGLRSNFLCGFFRQSLRSRPAGRTSSLAGAPSTGGFRSQFLLSPPLALSPTDVYSALSRLDLRFAGTVPANHGWFQLAPALSFLCIQHSASPTRSLSGGAVPSNPGLFQPAPALSSVYSAYLSLRLSPNYNSWHLFLPIGLARLVYS